MAVVPIITVPNDLLLQTCEKVKEVDMETKNLIQNLLDTLKNAKNPEGAGLAAPQIGVLKRVLIARRFLPNPNGSDEPLIKDYILINPKITFFSEEKQLGWEACLSIPNSYGKVERSKKIKVTALDEDGNPIKINATGFFARVIQHEVDHLDGILFTSKMVGRNLTEKEFDNWLKDKNFEDDEE